MDPAQWPPSKPGDRNLELSGHDNIAAAHRHHSRDSTRTLTTLGIISA
jgi:hypothetical protein